MKWLSVHEFMPSFPDVATAIIAIPANKESELTLVVKATTMCGNMMNGIFVTI